MHKTARQKYLLDLISENGQVSISELVDKLQVSADTVRRDLSDLEKKGLAQKPRRRDCARSLCHEPT